MFGFSKSLKTLNTPPSIVIKAPQEGPRKRHTQVMQPPFQPVKKPNTKFY